MDIYRKEVNTPYQPKEGDNFDSNYCNKQDQIDKQAYEYYLNKITNENFFQKFYYNYYVSKIAGEIYFEMDNVQYKFNNVHEDNTKDNKNESTTGRHNHIGSTYMNTPRILDLHSSTISHNYNFNQSNISQRKLFSNNNL
jgi:hypothetical protein